MISVIVPVYNCEKYVARCIESILNQTYRDWELLIVNDGSTDGSAAIIRQYAAKDSRIRYFEQENQGVSMARNRGIDEAKGEYILFVDGDDFLEQDALARLIACQQTQHFDCVSYMMRSIALDGKELRSNRMNQGTLVYSFDDMSQFVQFIRTGGGGPFYSSCSHLFNAEIIHRNNIRFTPEIVLGEDSLFCQKYSLFVNRGCILSDYVGYNYVKHAAESTAIYNDDWYRMVEQPMLHVKAFSDFILCCGEKQRGDACLAYISWELLTYIASCYKKNKDKAKALKNNEILRKIVYPSIMKYAPLRRKMMSIIFRISMPFFCKILGR